jgi:hypothetical protein
MVMCVMIDDVYVDPPCFDTKVSVVRKISLHR